MATTCSPFSSAVVRCMQRIYPECLADKSFDNTGLLLEAPLNRHRRLRNSVLLTVDLTKAVADEAISRGYSIIIAYRMSLIPAQTFPELLQILQMGCRKLTSSGLADPIIFRGLKSITLANSQQHSLLRLAQEGISVYSPHTAVDATPGAMADWLCQCAVPPAIPQPTIDTIYPNPSPPPEPNFQGAGMGRKLTFDHQVPLNDILQAIAKRAFPSSPPQLGFSIAIPQGKSRADINIITVAACPGSGSSILMKNGSPVADLLLTGELSHHDALAAIEAGSVVVTLSHSNSERGYLQSHMRQALSQQLEAEWRKTRDEAADHMRVQGEEGKILKEILGDDSLQVNVSEQDRDPYDVVFWKDGKEI
ncbi:hypothetical protein McanMca71_002321 [Microsporum canis]|uniref:UPF0135 protein n=1 Tax=Arthroderma otae (strain ATCC MYA-4605 / CBS 113480) TaxID=554155 RepID=C5FL61_ARTOC|nr:UPF0135 protein [Microsporum canis CBS 113480]EEQ30433.1 UPF0135 protein [Microsporum canis CBS 113480]